MTDNTQNIYFRSCQTTLFSSLFVLIIYIFLNLNYILYPETSPGYSFGAAFGDGDSVENFAFAWTILLQVLPIFIVVNLFATLFHNKKNKVHNYLLMNGASIFIFLAALLLRIYLYFD